MRIVYNRIPNPAANGDIRIFNFIKKLSRHYKITLLTLKPKKECKYFISGLNKFCDIILIKNTGVFEIRFSYGIPQI